MKNIYKYIAVFSAIAILTILLLYFQSVNNAVEDIKETNSTYSLKLIEKENSWIYEVYNQEQLYIRQEYIPAVKGKQVFKTKEDAQKVGQVVINKLTNKTLPVVTVAELTNNNISFQ
ncbi:DUF4907 domain-containing protein [Lacinutrix sp. C3R15]|uniref:DUF4907 domain-containing protein n=1 Tax=Flavobacteriaceae TaxID=49546 RepID=UPI001C0879D8|nr:MULTISPECIES: DUF4907 domain-containing protein [Flavobacteriaceae]MBU2938505.1 DUF4907 domain-containing protein [Lacinutrix sp. C3R15]MDO6621819.1 DUF4907 domain-containing protein [Oceanihabitans sp. 1_MG-2023]